MISQTSNERKLLKLSVYGALFFSFLAIIWGVLSNSKIILFDGVYSMISVGLSSISLITAAYIQKKDFERFPYGKEMLEPVIILGKFLVITILCLFSLFSGVSAMLSGGQEVDAGSGIIYAAIATISCYIYYYIFSRKNKTIDSGLVAAESQQWLMDAYLSGAVLLGFILSFILSKTFYSQYTPYMDPLMVILVSAYFLKVPIASMGKQLKEVLDMKADDTYIHICRQAVDYIEEKYGFEESFLRVSKSGPKLFIEVDFVVNAEKKNFSIADQDHIRQEITDKLQDIKLKKWLNVAFTSDRKWAI